jgi:glycosyltransferase involved in cell wall biosynthesis
MKYISILTLCEDEAEYVRDIYEQVKTVMAAREGYTYEHIFLDNHSEDGSIELLRDIADMDPRVKVIRTTRAFPVDKAMTYGLFQCEGEAAISTYCNPRDNMSMIGVFLDKWESGVPVILAQRDPALIVGFREWARKKSYALVEKISNLDALQNITGFALYDRKVLDMIRWMNDPEPYMRGLIPQLGYPYELYNYFPNVYQPKNGKRYTATLDSYLSYAFLGMTHASNKPLRIATFLGMIMSGASFLIAIVFLILKLAVFPWYEGSAIATIISLFVLGSIQLLVIAGIGEYIGAILTRITKRPMVIEAERLNFDEES